MSDSSHPNRARTVHDKSHYGRHEEIIQIYVEHGWSRLNWKREVSAMVSRSPWCGSDGFDGEELRQAIRETRLIPDAYRMIVEEPSAERWKLPVLVVEMLEVVVTNGISRRKLREYFHLWGACDVSDCVHLRLLTVDFFGYQQTVLDENPVEMYYACGYLHRGAHL